MENPDRPGAVLGVLPLTGGGIATSGTAQRGEHIVDPQTGRPATELRAVTVIGPSLLWADVYATAAFAWGVDGFVWLAEHAGYKALVVLPDGATRATPACERCGAKRARSDGMDSGAPCYLAGQSGPL